MLQMLVYSYKTRRVIKANNLCTNIKGFEHQRFRKVYPRELTTQNIYINVNDIREQKMPETSLLTYQRVCWISLHREY